jgi:TRAP-type mannitol/chloroaromatic compound transport system permease small subunit
MPAHRPPDDEPSPGDPDGAPLPADRSTSHDSHAVAIGEPRPDDPVWLRALAAVRVVIERISGIGGWCARYLVLFVFAIGLLNVVLRYAGRATQQTLVTNAWVDLQWQGFALLFLLGIGYAVREGVNPRVDFISQRFTPRRAAAIDLVLHAGLFLPFCVFALSVFWPYSATALGRRSGGTWPTWQVWTTWEGSANPGGLPAGPIKAVIVLGLVLLVLQIVAEIIKSVFVLLGRDDLARIDPGGIRPRVE